MKLLIIAGTPGLLVAGNEYNGGGWIAALQRKIIDRYNDSIDLALVHFNTNYPDITTTECRYYSVPLERKSFIYYARKEERYKQRLYKVLEKESPDIILCFGTEMPFALIQQMTDIPIILHIQGLLNPITEFLLPHAMSWFGYLKDFQRFLTYIIWRKNAERERRILSSVKYVLGRTEWDKKITELMAPQANYYYCSEMIRPAIYNSKICWRRKERLKKSVISIISAPFYKGADVILRCAKLLKNYLVDPFEWNVYGIIDANDMSKLTGIHPEDVNVFFKGVINEKQLIDVVTDADVFVHPSYIENSPNTVCEAQLLGVPVISTDVGGTSSIIRHNETGILVPSNDIYLMAANIKMLFNDGNMALKLGSAGRIEALDRHNPDKIVDSLVHLLNEIRRK